MYFTQWTNDLSDSFQHLQCKIGKKEDTQEAGFQAAKKQILQAKSQGSKIAIIGNGGSQSIASHISQDILNKLSIPTFTISDPSLLTCFSNDFGYENAYERSLAVLLNEHDLLIAISSSGESKNIIRCIDMANKKGIHTITLSAFNPGNALYNCMSSIAFYLPTFSYGIAEVGHLTILHALIDELINMTVQTKEFDHVSLKKFDGLEA